MSPSAPPPTAQEILRKLSIHSVTRSKTSTNAAGGLVSGTESDSDSVLTLDVPPLVAHGASMQNGPSSSQPPLSSIAERCSDSGDDSEDEEAAFGGWKTAETVDLSKKPRNSLEESVIKAGYLWKKGERRKTWKKRWFVLRPAHIAYYKSSKEYQILRLLELSDVHSCTQVNLKRHENTFGLISASRTFYLQASTPQEVQQWVKAIEDARETLLSASTQTSATAPIIISQPKPASRSLSQSSARLSSSPNQFSGSHVVVSSDSEDASNQNYYAASSPTKAAFALSPSKVAAPNKDPAKTVLSGYLMKCDNKRRNWRKRWFVLTGEKLFYSGSHMDTKPHREFPFIHILDALEYTLPPNMHRQGPASNTSAATGNTTDADEAAGGGTHTFKIVTTKRNLLLCAPTEEDEIKWLGAIRALIVRRTELGQVPGKASKSPSAPAHVPGAVGAHVTVAGAGGPPHLAGSTSSKESGAAPNVADGASHPHSPPTAAVTSGIRNNLRRLSGAGSTLASLASHSHPDGQPREVKASS